MAQRRTTIVGSGGLSPKVDIGKLFFVLVNGKSAAVRRFFSTLVIVSLTLSPLQPLANAQDVATGTTSSILEVAPTSSGEVGQSSSGPEVSIPNPAETAAATSTPETPTGESGTTSTTPTVPSVVQGQEKEASSTISASSSSEEATNGAVVTTPESVTPPQERPSKQEKFRKDNGQSEEAQLAAVRQHLREYQLPQEVLGRLDDYEAHRNDGPKEKGFLKKFTEFFTGDPDVQKAQRDVEELAKKQPFKVEGFSGDVRKANADEYKQLFSSAKEQGGVLEKIKNLLKDGTLHNSNFDGTKKGGGPLSALFGRTAVAQVSQNPNDYLAEGGEVTFSQAIQNKANALGKDPLVMLNFVRNSVAYTPYYGSKKGSDATLIEGVGNDMDQASLLIAMLRYSGVPARYRHVDIKADIGTVTDLLGVNSANAAAEVLGLHNIPYILFVDGQSNPLFFVLEHTYVEAYMPYGYSRGANVNDGGDLQWVPMDPTVNAYYYEQDSDVIQGMNAGGFNIETFFDNYLNGVYGTSTEPLNAFKTQVTTYLASQTPSSTYQDALTRFYPKNQNLDFIPGSLPYEVAADLNTYNFIPSSLRHSIAFTVKNDQNTTVLSYTGYVSDLADSELLLAYDAATPADQATLDSFATIYDVVPLSLVTVKPTIKVNGATIVTGSASAALGRAQSYTMDFAAPTRSVGGSIASSIIETVSRNVITGNTDAIALDTNRVVPPELRPQQDTATTSFVANQVLWKTGVDYLYRLENTEAELARVIGGDFTDTVTRATIFNGLTITYNSSSQPYSFDWKGLRIDSSAKVKYFNRMNQDTSTHKREFIAIFGLQASQDESDIFEDNFNVESVATVKGLKLVSSGAFPGITLKKITSANESVIDTLSISATSKAVFHTAVQAGKTIYTPSAPVTYGNWNGLFYISININAGEAGYIIGEGLNGGFTISQFASVQAALLRSGDITSLTAIILSPANNQVFDYGDMITWTARYTATMGTTTNVWDETGDIPASYFRLSGTTKLYTGYGTVNYVNVTVGRTTLGGEGKRTDVDQEIIDAVAANNLPSQFASVFKLMVNRESGFETLKMRYEPCKDKTILYQVVNTEEGPDYLVNTHPFSAWRLPGPMPTGTPLLEGTYVDGLKNKHDYTPQEMIRKFSNSAGTSDEMKVSEKDSIYTVWSNNDAAHGYTTKSRCGSASITSSTANYPAQLLGASSYGLGQIVFAYHWQRFDPAPPVRDIWEMFARKTNIEIGIAIFAEIYNSPIITGSGNQGIACDSSDRLWRTIGSYNGDITFPEAQGYANQICAQYKKDNYKLTTQ